MNHVIQIVEDSEELSRVAAEYFARLAVQAVHDKGLFTVALAGGSTPRKLYSLLSSFDRVPWGRIFFFWGDERHVPPDHPDSNYRMAQEALLSKVPGRPENIKRIRSEIEDASKAADEYEETLRECFALGIGGFPRFNLVLLGLGSDGHTASLFPGSDVINETRRLVMAPWIDKLKTSRITLTPPVLNNAEAVIFLVSGSEKANALHAVLAGDFQPERFPAQVIRENKSRVLWLVDHEAASMVRSSVKS